MFFPHWVERNLYVNIQTFASKWLDGFTTSDIPTAALKAFRYYPEAKRTGVGDHYGLPWRSNPRLLFVNVDMLRESGLSDLLNQERWTTRDGTGGSAATNADRAGQSLEQSGNWIPGFMVSFVTVAVERRRRRAG